MTSLRGTVEPGEPGSAGLRRQLEVATGAVWRAGNTFAEADAGDGSASSAVEIAREHVLATITTAWPKRARELLALAVAARARAGVSTRALVQEGALEAGYLERMEAQGCEVVVLAGARPARGVAVVDARTAWTPQLRIEGPLVRDLVAEFQRSWLDGIGELLPASLIPALDASGHAHGALVPEDRLELAMRLLVAAARRRVVLRVPAPGAALAIELVAAARAGLDVDRGRVAGRTSAVIVVDDAIALVASPGAPAVMVADRAVAPTIAHDRV